MGESAPLKKRTSNRLTGVSFIIPHILGQITRQLVLNVVSAKESNVTPLIKRIRWRFFKARPGRFYFIAGLVVAKAS